MGLYHTEVLADTPDHYWRLADPGGFLCADIGATPHTASTPAASLPYTGPIADGGGAALTGSGGFRMLENIALPSPQTLECWYFPTITPLAVFIAAFDGTTNEWGLSTNAAAQVAMSVNNTNVISATAITREAWHHIVGAYDGANARLYLDGVLVAGPTAIAAPANIGRQLFWGSAPSGLSIAYGVMAELATYPHNLTAARVTAHFTASDVVATRPVFRTSAVSGSGTAADPPVTSADSLQLILNAVRKKY